MNQLSEEQQQERTQILIEEFCDRWGWIPSPSMLLDLKEQITSLLETDSQAATLHYFKDRGDRQCATCGSLKLWQYQIDEEIDPATAMRDKCVEKVKEVQRNCEQTPATSEDYEYDQAVAWRLAGIVNELESLTLDQVKPGEM